MSLVSIFDQGDDGLGKCVNIRSDTAWKARFETLDRSRGDNLSQTELCCVEDFDLQPCAME